MWPFYQSKTTTEMVIHSLGVLISNANKIEDPEYKSIDELREELRAKDPVGLQMLDDFTEIYWRWFEFHEKRKGKEEDVVIVAELVELIAKRDESRKAIIDKYK